MDKEFSFDLKKPVSFELSKLLKEKGFGEKSKSYNSVGKLVTVSLSIRRFNTERVYYPAPSISEVLDWIYSKYDIWVSLIPDLSSGYGDRRVSVSIFRFNRDLDVQVEVLKGDKNILYFNLSEDTFDYVINYILNNI